MKALQTVGIHNYKLEISSAEFLLKIDVKNLQAPNPLRDRSSIIDLPLSKLALGYSLWFDTDTLSPEMVKAVMRAVRYYNRTYNCFDWKKHRGDARISGFKFLEIARIK